MKKGWSQIGMCLLIVCLVACKKDVKTPEDSEIKPPQTDRAYESDAYENLVKDSVFYYTKLFSLWQDELPPKNINDLEKEGYIRQNYTRYFERGEYVLDWMISIPKDAKGVPIDRFSFLDREGVVSDEIQDAVATSFGMYVFYLQTEESGNNADLYIRMVDKGSPAYGIGLERGDRIISINDDTKIDYNSQQADDFKGINNYLNFNNLKIRFKKLDGRVIEKSIASTRYNLDPILDSRVMMEGNKKIGYLAFSSFVSVINTVNEQASFTPMYYRFEEIFDDFQSEGIQELVIDLRYNGGGSTATAEYLVNRIIPSSADKKLMYRYEINSLLKSWGWDRQEDGFAPVSISKKGNLELSRVYFLVTKGSASASELLINVLKPYMQVYMIGTYAVDDKNNTVAEKTYGKPAGFFEWKILDDDIGLYATSFKMYNSRNEGDYFDGLIPNAHVWEFQNFLSFGNPNESMLASALNHIKGGSFAAKAARMTIASSGKVLTRRPKVKAGIQKDIWRSNMFKFNEGNVKLR